MRIAPIERGHVAQHRTAAERRERLGTDEALGVGGHGDLHAMTVAHEQADELTRPVGGDAARYAEQKRRPWGRRLQAAAGSSHSIFPAASSSSAIVR